MDLHIVGAEPTSDERAAVDAVLGAPDSGWRGGARDVEHDGRASRGGREMRAERHLLLPALHGVQDRIGWISRGALNYICRRLTVPPAEAWGVLTFYHLLSSEPRPPIVAHVCDDIACRLKGADGICADLEAALGPATQVSHRAESHRDGSAGRSNQPPPRLRRSAGASAKAEDRPLQATWMRSPCLGQCDRAPAALIIAAGPQVLRQEHTGLTSAAEVLRALETCGGRSLDRPAKRQATSRVAIIHHTVALAVCNKS